MVRSHMDLFSSCDWVYSWVIGWWVYWGILLKVRNISHVFPTAHLHFEQFIDSSLEPMPAGFSHRNMYCLTCINNLQTDRTLCAHKAAGSGSAAGSECVQKIRRVPKQKGQRRAGFCEGNSNLNSLAVTRPDSKLEPWFWVSANHNR